MDAVSAVLRNQLDSGTIGAAAAVGSTVMAEPFEAMDGLDQRPLAWAELNLRWLKRELARLRARIDRQVLGEAPKDSTEPGPDGEITLENELKAEFVSGLDRCAALFGLSEFERELLLLTAGVELDAGLGRSVLRAQGGESVGARAFQPTFSLAFRLLERPHWDALSPDAPLRRWRLIDVEGRSPAHGPLSIDERVLHFVAGVDALDSRLVGLVRVEAYAGSAASSTRAQDIARALTSSDERAPLVLLDQHHGDVEALHDAARAGLATLGAPGLWLLARDLPTDRADLAELAVRIDREAAMTGGVPVIEVEGAVEGAAEHEQRALALLSQLIRPAILLAQPAPSKLARLVLRRIARVDVPDENVQALAEQGAFRLDGVPPDALAAALRPALQQFRLSRAALRRVLEQVQAEALAGDARPLAARIWAACRHASRGGLEELGQRLGAHLGFDDVVLPDAQLQMLRDIVEHVNYRHTVYGEWGMGGKTGRGQGLCALFAGESGTGKTLAAEAIAKEARLDLYRIDLAAMVSKYIGETEKNLKRVFDAAEASGAVLLFDEADALYGKRSDVRDSHDRYANMEVAYLLQRVEAYRGLAILTTNFRSALDRAFLRRIRFVVQFPFPDEAAREQIWRRELPASAPTRGVDFTALARMKLSGGNIRTIAVNAAFIAARAGEPISMGHLRQAAHREAAKLERADGGV